jgi:hypothetical protein
MLAFWPDIIHPLLDALQPHDIVEIGSEHGKMTSRLIEFARTQGARVHAVDPEPRFDVEAWMRDAAGAFIMHRLPSLVALPAIESFDVVLIDGDHNWFTVYHELRMIEQLCKDRGQPLPLTFLHDVAWPYGRRDLYYAPETIPEQYRHPYARQGILPTSSALAPRGGYNAGLCNAMHEGGPRNGVLTAVEDYLEATSTPMELVQIPAVFGLAILLPETLAQARPEVAERVRAWARPEISSFLNRLEMARIAMLLQLAG